MTNQPSNTRSDEIARTLEAFKEHLTIQPSAGSVGERAWVETLSEIVEYWRELIKPE
jgi:hypothetical protein